MDLIRSVWICSDLVGSVWTELICLDLFESCLGPLAQVMLFHLADKSMELLAKNDILEVTSGCERCQYVSPRICQLWEAVEQQQQRIALTP